MPPRTVLIIGALLIVVLVAIIPVAFLMGGRHAASQKPVVKSSPNPAAATSTRSAPVRAPSQEAPATTTADPSHVPAEAEGGTTANAARSHAKGGGLGGVVATVGDDVAAEGKHIADDFDGQGHAVVAKARADSAAALTKTVDHAAASVQSAADQLEDKAQQAADSGVRSVLHEPHDAAQAGADDPSFRAFVDGVTKQEAETTASLATLSANLRSDLAAAAKEVSTKVHAYGDGIKKLSNPLNLLHSVTAADEAAIARDIDKQAAQVRAALEAFTAATDAIQHKCDESIAQLRQGMIDERAKLTAQLNQASASCDKEIAALRAHLSSDIAQAVAAATSPLDEGQAKPRTTRPGR
jgi:hypothetical protein